MDCRLHSAGSLLITRPFFVALERVQTKGPMPGPVVVDVLVRALCLLCGEGERGLHIWMTSRVRLCVNVSRTASQQRAGAKARGGMRLVGHGSKRDEGRVQFGVRGHPTRMPWWKGTS